MVGILGEKPLRRLQSDLLSSGMNVTLAAAAGLRAWYSPKVASGTTSVP